MGCHFLLQCMKVKSESEVAQSCPTLIRDLMDCSLPGSSAHGIGVPLPSSRALQSEKLIPDLSRCSLRLVESLLFKKKAPQITDHSEHDNLSNLSESCSVMSYSFATPWTVACQAPLSMEFSRPEYWSVLPFLSARESSQPKDQTWVSCIAGGFFTV